MRPWALDFAGGEGYNRELSGNQAGKRRTRSGDAACCEGARHAEKALLVGNCDCLRGSYGPGHLPWPSRRPGTAGSAGTAGQGLSSGRHGRHPRFCDEKRLVVSSGYLPRAPSLQDTGKTKPGQVALQAVPEVLAAAVGRHRLRGVHSAGEGGRCYYLLESSSCWCYAHLRIFEIRFFVMPRLTTRCSLAGRITCRLWRRDVTD